MFFPWPIGLIRPKPKPKPVHELPPLSETQKQWQELCALDLAIMHEERLAELRRKRERLAQLQAERMRVEGKASCGPHTPAQLGSIPRPATEC